MIAVFKRELIGFFKNPIAYVIMAVYAFLSALLFSMFIILNNTSYLGGYFGLWLIFVEALICAILSMRFFTEEKKNKTDQLLFTSPVSLNRIVLGKFFGAFAVYFACTCINFIYVFIVDLYGDIDYGSVLVWIIGSLFLGSAMLSVSLFVSSFSGNAIASAGATVGIYILMALIDVVTAFLSEVFPVWLLKFLKRLNIFYWFNDFSAGLLSIPAIVFYLSIAAAFVFLSVRVLERRRWR